MLFSQLIPFRSLVQKDPGTQMPQKRSINNRQVNGIKAVFFGHLYSSVISKIILFPSSKLFGQQQGS